MEDFLLTFPKEFVKQSVMLIKNPQQENWNPLRKSIHSRPTGFCALKLQ